MIKQVIGTFRPQNIVHCIGEQQKGLAMPPNKPKTMEENINQT